MEDEIITCFIDTRLSMTRKSLTTMIDKTSMKRLEHEICDVCKIQYQMRERERVNSTVKEIFRLLFSKLKEYF